jgi:hypothetical protein
VRESWRSSGAPRIGGGAESRGGREGGEREERWGHKIYEWVLVVRMKEKYKEDECKRRGYEKEDLDDEDRILCFE